MNNVTPETIDKILSLGEGTTLDLVKDGGPTAVALPNGRTLHSIKKLIDEYAPRPDRREGTDKATDIASLVEWTNRHKDEHSVVFCDATRDAPKLLAVIDYHRKGEGDDKARFRRFRSLYEFPLDQRWKDWKAIDGEEMNQVDFAAFIEDHALDLIAPDVSIDGQGQTVTPLPSTVTQLLGLMGGRCAFPNEMIALSRGLDITANNKVVNRVDLQSGEGAIVFESSHTDGNGKRIDIPRLFMIAIPLFERSSEHYRIPVRIRYQLKGGAVMWSPTMFGADDVIDMAIRDAAREVREKTDLPLFFGWPA